jgi:hypothetical protein
MIVNLTTGQLIIKTIFFADLQVLLTQNENLEVAAHKLNKIIFAYSLDMQRKRK